MDDPMVMLSPISDQAARAVVERLLRDPAKFEVVLARQLVDAACPPSARDFFQRYASVKAAYGDLSLSAETLTTVVVRGTAFWTAGSDVDSVALLLDAAGAVFEWDGQVLDGPMAPSLWHYVLWIANTLYDEPLEV